MGLHHPQEEHTMGADAMSGWQRIGVVVSVLWFVGLPVFFMIAANPGVSPADVIALFFGTGKAFECGNPCSPSARWDMMFVMWTFLLGPIVLLWLVGWIVLGTVRWVRRGFTGPGR
jgi:hypothetical protein